MVWLRQLILILGSTLFATSAILSTFMGGLALGSFLAGRVADRSRYRPLRLYGLLETGIGLYALVVPILFRALTPFYQAVWEHGGSESFTILALAKFVGVALVLLPPTILMGASLPVLARHVADDPARIGAKVGMLYATNTFGAMAGTFLAGFVAVRALGVHRTEWVTATINLAIGAAAIILSRSARPLPPVPARVTSPSPLPRSWIALVAFGASGCAAMVLEVAWTRGLSLIVGSSVYAFALMLLAFLSGLASGGAVFSTILRRRPDRDPGALLAILFAASGVLTYATAFLFQAMPGMFGRIYFGLHLGPDAWFGVQFLFGLAVMFPATFALGGIFPAVLQIHARGLDHVAGSVGSVYVANTTGTIVGAALAGFAIVPILGVRDTLLAVALLEVALGLVAAWTLLRRAGPARTLLAAPMAVALVVMPVVKPGWDILLMNSGAYINVWDLPNGSKWKDFLDRVTHNNRLVYFAEGLTASVLVADQPEIDNRYLSVNGKVEASTAGDMETQLMCAHLPLLLHPGARDVMVIGLASGITAGAAACHPVDSIRIVEIEAAMVPAAGYFADANGHVLEDPRVKVSINDARNELTFSPRSYDVIASEPSNPWMTVASNLFTEDFFRLARGRLRPGGIFSQWLQTYGLPPEDLRSIVAAFQASFPHAMMFETFDGIDVLLLGSDRPLRFDLDAIEHRMSELRVRMDLARIGIRHAIDILPLFRLGEAEMLRLVRGASRNTDDNARVEFSAPRALLEDTTEANLLVFKRFAGDPLDYVVPRPRDSGTADRLRLNLARAWWSRNKPEQALATARSVLNGPLAAEARKFVADNHLK